MTRATAFEDTHLQKSHPHDHLFAGPVRSCNASPSSPGRRTAVDQSAGPRAAPLSAAAPALDSDPSLTSSLMGETARPADYAEALVADAVARFRCMCGHPADRGFAALVLDPGRETTTLAAIDGQWERRTAGVVAPVDG